MPPCIHQTFFIDLLTRMLSIWEEGWAAGAPRPSGFCGLSINPIGEARPDWIIVADLARKMLERDGRIPIGPHAAWQYAGPSEVMEEIAGRLI